MIKSLIALLFFPVFASAQSGGEKDLAFSGFYYPITVEIKAGKETGEICYESDFSAAPEKEYQVVLLQGVMPATVSLDIIAKSRSFFTADVRLEQTGFRRYPNGRFWARYKAPAPTSRPVKFTVTDLGLKSNSTLTLYATELLTEAELSGEALKEDEVPVSTAAYIPEADLFVPQSAPFTLVRRAAWQAKPPKEPYTRHAPYYFTLHHTQAHYPKTYDEAVLEMQFIQDFHQNGRGWNDIGYHFLIDPAGNIFEGRPINVMGAHVLSRNTGNVGISILGNYHPPSKDVFTPATQDSFVAVGQYVKDTYSVHISSFYAHREIGNTDCPGDNLYAKKNLLRDLIFTTGPQPVPADQDAPISPRQAQSLERLKNFLNRD